MYYSSLEPVPRSRLVLLNANLVIVVRSIPDEVFSTRVL